MRIIFNAPKYGYAMCFDFCDYEMCYETTWVVLISTLYKGYSGLAEELVLWIV